MKASWSLATASVMLASVACGGMIDHGTCTKETFCAQGPSMADGTQGGSRAVPPGDYVRPAPLPPETPIEGELVTGLTNPWQLAVDAANVYFGANGEVLSCKKSGCGGKAVKLGTAVGGVMAIVADGAEVFWADQTGIVACPAGGCSGAPRVVTRTVPMAMTIVDDMLYWVTLSGQVERCSRNCATPETLATDSNNGVLQGIAVSGNDIYWTTMGNLEATGINGLIRTCSLAGPCVPKTIAEHQNSARTIAARNGTLAWTADGESTVRRCSLPSCSELTSLFMAGQLGLAMDDDRIYWSYGSTGWIRSASLAGAGAAEIVSGQTPTFLAVDDTNLYWINTDIPDSRGGVAGSGRIMSLRKKSP